MKKKPARQPRKIEVVEDEAVATKATKRKAKPAPTDATPAQARATNAMRRTERHSREVWAKKGKTKVEAPATEAALTTKAKKSKPQSERKPEQPSTIARVEGKLEGKLSAIEAAAKVLESSGPLNCKELIEAMSTADSGPALVARLRTQRSTRPSCARLQPRAMNLGSLRRSGDGLRNADL